MSKVELKHKFAQKDQERKTRKELTVIIQLYYKIASIFSPENEVVLILSCSAGCHRSAHIVLSRTEKGKTSMRNRYFLVVLIMLSFDTFVM